MTTLSLRPLIPLVALLGLASPVGCSSAFTAGYADAVPYNGDAGPVDEAGFSYDGRVDAGVAISLCNVVTGDGGTCDPDNGAAMAGMCPSSADAGALSDGGPYVPPALACRVEPSSDMVGPVSCQPAGQGQDGDACTSGSDCSAGFECVSSPGRCRHYCCDSTICPAIAKTDTAASMGLFCDVQSEAAHSGVKVPVCLPVLDCQLLGNTCGSTATCAIVDSSAGIKSCVETGPASVGQSCETTHCGANLSCLGTPGKRTCQQLCDPTMPSACPTGQLCKQPWMVLKADNAGICQ